MKVTAPERLADLSLGEIREVLTDLDVVRQALADASAWRAWKAEGAGCPDCQRLDPGRSADHAADNERAAAHEALLRRLAGGGTIGINYPSQLH